MRRRRPTRTARANASKWRYKGLSKREAHLRAKKAWQTKKQRYSYKGNVGQFNIRGSQEQERLARLRAKMEAERRGAKSIENIEDLDQMEAELRAQGLVGKSTADYIDYKDVSGAPRRVRDEFSQEQILEERKHWARYRDFKDPRFRDLMRSSEVTNPERDAFFAATRQFEQFEERQKISFFDEKTGDIIPERDYDKLTESQKSRYRKLSRDDEAMLGSKDEAREIRENLSTYLNKDPAEGRDPGKVFRPKDEFERLIDSEVDKILGPIEQDPGEPDLRDKYRDRLRARRRQESLRKQAEYAVDPAHAELLRRRADGIEQDIRTNLESDRDALKRSLKSSHDPDLTPAQRRAAAEEARRVIGRVSSRVGAQREKDRVVREIREDYPDFFRPRTSAEQQKTFADLLRERDEVRTLMEVEDQKPKNKRQQPVVDSYKHRLDEINARLKEHKQYMPKTDPLPYDPRIQRTVEEAYQFSNHDQSGFQRLRWELERAKSKISKDEPAQGEAPPWFKEVRQQARFMKRMKENQRAGWSEGKTAFAINERGDVIPANPSTLDKTQRASWAIVPNKVYEYELRHAPGETDALGQRLPNYIEEVDYHDKDKKFHTGKRRADNTMVEGDWDEQVGIPRVREKFNDRVHYREGERVFVDPARQRELEHRMRDQNIDEVILMPVRQTPAQTTRTYNHPEEKRLVYYRRNPGARVATAQDYQRTAGGWGEGTEFGPGDIRFTEISRAEFDALPDREKGTLPIPKKVQEVYVHPDEIKVGKQRDQVSFQLPRRFRTKGKNKDTWRDFRIVTNLQEDTTRDKVVGNYVRARQMVQNEKRLEASTQLRHLETRERMYREMQKQRGVDVVEEQYSPQARDEFAKKRGFSGYGEMKELAGAAGAAGIYGIRRSIKKGHAPRAANKIVNKIGEKFPKIKEQFGESWNEQAFVVDEAYARPAREWVNRKKKQFRHPFTSPEGSDFGVDWGRWKYREHWRLKSRGGIDKRELLRMERNESATERVIDTFKHARQHRGDKGPIGAIRNWRMEPMMGHPDYKHFNTPVWEGGHSFLSRRHELADAYLTVKPGEYTTFRDPITDKEVRVKVTKKMQEKAISFKRRLAMAEMEMGHGQLPPRPPKPPRNWSSLVPDPKKPTTIAAGVVAAAAVAHYGRHKYVEHKKHPNDRIAYYNKILPPAFEVPVVKVRQTAWYRTPDNAVLTEFGFNNRKVAVKAGVSLQKKRIALRPMDWEEHAPHPNAPIFGGIRSAKRKGGNLGKSVQFEQEDIRTQLGRKRKRQNEYDILVKDKNVGKITFGKREPIKRTATNPNKLTQSERDEIVWAHAGGPDENAIKAFYTHAGERDRIVDMLEDPDEVRRVRRQKGEKETQRHYRKFYTQHTRTQRRN